MARTIEKVEAYRIFYITYEELEYDDDAEPPLAVLVYREDAEALQNMFRRAIEGGDSSAVQAPDGTYWVFDNGELELAPEDGWAGALVVGSFLTEDLDNVCQTLTAALKVYGREVSRGEKDN